MRLRRLGIFGHLGRCRMDCRFQAPGRHPRKWASRARTSGPIRSDGKSSRPIQARLGGSEYSLQAARWPPPPGDIPPAPILLPSTRMNLSFVRMKDSFARLEFPFARLESPFARLELPFARLETLLARVENPSA